MLRSSRRGRIPDSVRNRVEKMGFPTSLHTWVTGVLANPLRDILASRAARERGIYKVDEMLRLLQNGHRIEPRDALRLFHVAEFELWHGIHRSYDEGSRSHRHHRLRRHCRRRPASGAVVV